MVGPRFDVAAVTACVANFADVCHRGIVTSYHILHELVRRGLVDCVAACLKALRKIELTTRDGESRSTVLVDL